MIWRQLGREGARGLLAYVRVWTAGIGGVLGGFGAVYLLIEERGSLGSVLGILCLVLAACALVAAFFGIYDRDIRGIRGWVGAGIALVLGFATIVVAAAGSATGT